MPRARSPRFCEESPRQSRRIAGIHLEGPYITPEDGPRGAHPKRYCRKPDWEEFQRLQAAAGGRIRILTMSPECEHAAAFIRRVSASGVLVALGHTSADSDQIRAAVDAGARLSTHLGNGSHPTFHRFRNHLWPQLADDRLMASLIVDGHHLTPEMVRVFVRTKTPQRCILISDLSGQAGQPPGRYSSLSGEIELLPNGKLVVAGQHELMAGASATLNVAVANAVRFADVDLSTAIRMATENPARLLGMEPNQLRPGDPADLIQFEWMDTADPAAQGWRGLRTIVGGDVLWEATA